MEEEVERTESQSLAAKSEENVASAGMRLRAREISRNYDFAIKEETPANSSSFSVIQSVSKREQASQSLYRSSTRVCVRNCISIRRPEFECSGPQLEGPEFEYSGLSLKTKKDRFRKYEIDTIAKLAGHIVVRLPPYHCNFSAIELIWAQVKNDVAKHNVTFRLNDVTFLFQPISYIKKQIRQQTHQNWNTRWTTCTTGSLTRDTYFPTIHDRLKSHHSKPTFVTTQFLSGHGKFGTYFDRFNIPADIDFTCSCREVLHSVKHLLFDCPIIEAKRFQIKTHLLDCDTEYRTPL
ncbi:hypothetical protein ANN_06935 [Periplaneta americana]|uniref:Uncharacterized protein n=1 Tax=Periplaneta americana TaxID=6978 RepID=A0ABQ8TF12_PERAM|nr:hypothetical protein ANN_06935 [Periplaneta americana]